MSHEWHLLLLAAALVLNWGDRKAIALALMVALSLLMPVNKFTTHSNFYLVCGLFEILFALTALRIDTRASQYVATMCAVLCVFHFLGWSTNGYLQHSPYRILVKIAEYAEIIACICLSQPILRRLINVRIHRIG